MALILRVLESPSGGVCPPTGVVVGDSETPSQFFSDDSSAMITHFVSVKHSED